MREVVAGSRTLQATALVTRVGLRAVLPVVAALAALTWTTRHDDAVLVPSGHLRAYLLDAAAVQRLDDGARVAPGARVQLAYRVPVGEPSDPPADWYAVIYSVDDDGRRTLHFPRHEGARTLLERASGVLPASFELDDAPGGERFYFVLDHRPLSVERVLGAAAPASKPAFSLRKETRAPGGAEVR